MKFNDFRKKSSKDEHELESQYGNWNEYPAWRKKMCRSRSEKRQNKKQGALGLSSSVGSQSGKTYDDHDRQFPHGR